MHKPTKYKYIILQIYKIQTYIQTRLYKIRKYKNTQIQNHKTTNTNIPNTKYT